MSGGGFDSPPGDEKRPTRWSVKLRVSDRYSRGENKMVLASDAQPAGMVEEASSRIRRQRICT